MFRINNSEYQNYGLTFLEKEDSIVSILYDRFVINEMHKWQEAANNSNIKIAFFKGIIEKYDVYKSQSLYREYSDIDLLIERKDVYAFCDICKNLHYYHSAGEINKEWIDSSINTDSRHHLAPIIKNILNNNMTIGVEIHTVLDPAWNRNKNRDIYIQEIIQHRETYKCNWNFSLYGMDITDRIVFSFLHFSKDYLADFSTLYYCPEKQLFHGKTLMDAFLIVEKYHKQINVDDLVNRVIFFDLYYQTLFSCQMVTEVFELKPNNIFQKITQKLNDGISSHKLTSFIKKILYSSYITILEKGTKNKLDFYKHTIRKCISMNPMINAKKHVTTLLPLHNYTSNPQISVSYKWDDASFELRLELNKASINTYNNTTTGNYDGISIRVYNPSYTVEEDNAVRNLLVSFKETKSGTIIPDITFNGRNPFERGIIVVDNVSVNHIYEGGKIKVNISIPWESLKININNIRFIGMDCHVRTYSNQIEEVAYFSNIEEPFYNPAKFGMISFC